MHLLLVEDPEHCIIHPSLKLVLSLPLPLPLPCHRPFVLLASFFILLFLKINTPLLRRHHSLHPLFVGFLSYLVLSCLVLARRGALRVVGGGAYCVLVVLLGGQGQWQRGGGGT